MLTLSHTIAVGMVVADYILMALALEEPLAGARKNGTACLKNAIAKTKHSKRNSKTNNIMAKNETTINLGGCLPLILFIFTLTALWFGLPTPWGLFEIDIFPPGIYLDR